MEEWKPIEGYEGIYEVSSLGRVRSLDHKVRFGDHYRIAKGKTLIPYDVGAGYLSVSLGRHNKKYIHQLVARAFVDGYKKGLEVDHINENKHDNRVENLRWVTRKMNNSSPLHIQNISKAKSYIIIQYDMSGNYIAEYPSIINASIVTGVSKSTIARHIQGYFKHAGGFIWKRKQ